MGLTVVVTGGRDFADMAVVTKALAKVHGVHGIDLLVQGGAKGADHLALQWAKQVGVRWKTEPALWDIEGKAAGMNRNRRMLDKYRPELLVAFPGGKGTAGCIAEARRRDIPVWGPGIM